MCQSAETMPSVCQPDRARANSLGAVMFSELAWQEIARSLRLSKQQVQIVAGIFEDRTESNIAQQLQISPHTIHTYCERLYRKLGVTGRVRLTLRVINEYVALTLAPNSILPPLCANFAGGACPLRGGKPPTVRPVSPEQPSSHKTESGI